MKSVKLTKVGEHVLPVTVSSLHTIDSILDAVQQVYLQVKPNSAVNKKFQAVLKLIISLLEPFKNELENYCNTISFICEQLALIINKQASYSPQFAIFASLFYSVSPCAYWFIRNSGNCILPSYSTVCRVTLIYPLSPLNEQNDKNFLLYIRLKAFHLWTRPLSYLLTKFV